MFLSLIRQFQPVRWVLSAQGEEFVLDKMEQGQADRWIIASQIWKPDMQNNWI